MWDALVVGGGPAGCSTALALRGQGARVLLAERASARPAHPGESLVGEGLACLRELSVYEAFRSLEARPCYLHRVCWGGRMIEQPSLARRSGETHQLDRVAFDAMLLSECEKRGVTVRRGTTLTRIAADDQVVRAEFGGDAGERLRIECAFAVDATGRSAWVCRHLGARRERIDKLIAFAATFERSHAEPSSLIESGPHGWWYSAPRPCGLMTVMYATELLPAGTRDPASLWRSALVDAGITSDRVRGRLQHTQIRAYRAGPEWTQLDSNAPILPVGDAAFSFDPIAGDGLCFALRSGMEAAKAIGSASLRRAYREGTRRIYESHLQQREVAYSAERALRSSMFWQRPRDGSPEEGIRSL